MDTKTTSLARISVPDTVTLGGKWCDIISSELGSLSKLLTTYRKSKPFRHFEATVAEVELEGFGVLVLGFGLERSGLLDILKDI